MVGVGNVKGLCTGWFNVWNVHFGEGFGGGNATFNLDVVLFVLMFKLFGDDFLSLNLGASVCGHGGVLALNLVYSGKVFLMKLFGDVSFG